MPAEGAAADHDARRALAVVCLAVLLASATWFTGTAAAPVLRRAWLLTDAQGAALTTSVQLGFIVGTLLYATLNLADVFPARRVFLVSALLGAAFNLGFAWQAQTVGTAVVWRFLTGVTLAGVYPVAMKVVASWFRTGLGWRLGVMVGALGIGTASPYLIQALAEGVDWRRLVAAGSLAAAAGGLLLAVAIGDGPYLRRQAPFDVTAAARVFRVRPFRLTALGYFGHMWELYAFWGLLPFFLAARFPDPGARPSLALAAFAIVAAGAVGCVTGGWISRTVGERRVALAALVASAACSALSGLAFASRPGLLLAFLMVWGIVVVADSPQFSALAARHCPPEYTGTALTIQNGLGFAMTLATLHLVPWLAARVGWRWAFMPLAVGPLLGAWSMWRLGEAERSPASTSTAGSG
jgi:MFS family permease